MALSNLIAKLLDLKNSSAVLRFVMVGGTNFILVNSIYVSILFLFNDYHVAYWTSLIAGTAFVSYGNSRFVFQRNIKYYFLFPYLFYYILYSLTFYFILIYTIESGLLPKYFALAIVAVCIVPIHYVCSRVIIHSLGNLRSQKR